VLFPDFSRNSAEATQFLRCGVDLGFGEGGSTKKKGEIFFGGVVASFLEKSGSVTRDFFMVMGDGGEGGEEDGVGEIITFTAA